ncbi:MAG: type III pantothenate kinase [Bacteroidales bacterium]|nr:type III pantothenate kinase [Bacteroidales bacterium]
MVEIGNTALKAAWCDGNTLGKIFRYQGENMISYIISLTERQQPFVMTVSSSEVLEDETIARLSKVCGHLIVLDARHTDILMHYNIPDYLSSDRAASIIAARFMFERKPCAIFDFGSTLTIDFVDSTGRYSGGNVSPGFRTRFKALNRYSRSLPLVSTPVNADELGSSVESSIESGVVSGIMFEIEGYLRTRPDYIVIFTGGDAIYFAKKMKNSIFVVCNLVLMGLALITDEYVRKNI